MPTGTFRCGQSIGVEGEVTQVDFETAFLVLPHVVLTPFIAADVWLIEVTPTYFKWLNDQNKVPVTVDWIATDCGNV